MTAYWIVGIMTLLAATSPLAQNDSALQDVVTAPAHSSRCKELLEERQHKIKIRQRLGDLLQRNQNLLKKTPKSRVNMNKRLSASQITLRNELYLATLQVQGMEESIIRSGCPGINL